MTAALPVRANGARDARCIVYVASTSIYLARARLALLRRMVAEGWRVIGVAPEDAYTGRLLDVGVEWRPLPIAREIARPIRHLRLLGALTQLYRATRPTLVHHFTSNPIIYGSVAARLAGVPAVVNAFPGLGTVFESARWDAPILRTWLRAAYRVVTRLPNSRTIFQSGDDRDAFVHSGVVPGSTAVLIRGSGVDVDAFRPHPEPEGIPTVLFCGRMLQPKGVSDLVTAARLLRDWRVSCRIRLVGRCDAEHKGAVPLEQLRQWAAEGLVQWDGQRDDMPAVVAAAHIVCLPSYGEGVPRSLVEGAACGRPLVASDVPGCREIVVHERNGLLVPPRDPQRLAQALARLIRNPDERHAFGRAGREIAVSQFAEGSVIAATLEVYRTLATRNTLRYPQ
ncbi:MAG TPA: glycosyltransferase family 4 protein [Candidatus Dormibacteraeota bacterium]|nr:glycosyltransferase family 4 protein [Candidatus Dormibacteraeota bacterium]